MEMHQVRYFLAVCETVAAARGFLAAQGFHAEHGLAAPQGDETAAG